MSTKTKGGREYLDQTALDLADVRKKLRTINDQAKFNPDLVRKLAEEAERIVTAIERRNVDTLDPMLDRQERQEKKTGLEDRVTKLEDWREEIETRLPTLRILPRTDTG